MEPNEEEDTQYCQNCKRDIPSCNFIMHQSHCERKIMLCKKCNEPVPRSEIANHEKEYHQLVSCECGNMIENGELDEHKEKACPQRPANCEYCDLELPFEKITEHKHFCGSRTELCPKCKKYIKLCDQVVHETIDCTRQEKNLSHMMPNNKAPPGTMFGSSNLFFADASEGVGGLRRGHPFFDFSAMDGNFAVDFNGTPLQEHLPNAISEQRRDFKNVRTERKQKKNQTRVQNLHKPGNDRSAFGRSQEEQDFLYALKVSKGLNAGTFDFGGVIEADSVPEVIQASLPRGRLPEPFPSTFSMHESQEPSYNRTDTSLSVLDEEIPVTNLEREASSRSGPRGSRLLSQSSAENDLPCEFCSLLVSPGELLVHQETCKFRRPEDIPNYIDISPVVLTPPISPVRGPSPPISSVRRHTVPLVNTWHMDHSSSRPSQDNTVLNNEAYEVIMLPCEFCKEPFPAENLNFHQINCADNAIPDGPPSYYDALSDAPVAPTGVSSINVSRGSAFMKPMSPPPLRRTLRHQEDPELNLLHERLRQESLSKKKQSNLQTNTQDTTSPIFESIFYPPVSLYQSLNSQQQPTNTTGIWANNHENEFFRSPQDFLSTRGPAEKNTSASEKLYSDLAKKRQNSFLTQLEGTDVDQPIHGRISNNSFEDRQHSFAEVQGSGNLKAPKSSSGQRRKQANNSTSNAQRKPKSTNAEADVKTSQSQSQFQSSVQGHRVQAERKTSNPFNSRTGADRVSTLTHSKLANNPINSQSSLSKAVGELSQNYSINVKSTKSLPIRPDNKKALSNLQSSPDKNKMISQKSNNSVSGTQYSNVKSSYQRHPANVRNLVDDVQDMLQTKESGPGSRGQRNDMQGRGYEGHDDERGFKQELGYELQEPRQGGGTRAHGRGHERQRQRGHHGKSRGHSPDIRLAANFEGNSTDSENNHSSDNNGTPRQNSRQDWRPAARRDAYQ